MLSANRVTLFYLSYVKLHNKFLKNKQNVSFITTKKKKEI